MNPSLVSETIEDWLRRHKLEHYTEAMKEYGYDSLKALDAATEADLEEMAADPDVDMDEQHLHLLKEAWKQLNTPLTLQRAWERKQTAAAIKKRQKEEGYVSHERDHERELQAANPYTLHTLFDYLRPGQE